MGARQKLNWGYFNGSLLLAVAAGVLTQSWLVFLLGLVALVVLNVLLDEIRPQQRGQ